MCSSTENYNGSGNSSEEEEDDDAMKLSDIDDFQ